MMHLNIHGETAQSGCVFDTSKNQAPKDSLPLSGCNSDVQLAFLSLLAFTAVNGDNHVHASHNLDVGIWKSFLLEPNLCKHRIFLSLHICQLVGTAKIGH